MRPGDPNIPMLELMASRLGPLLEQLVFVGGCTTGLFVTDPLIPPVRVTRDVDVITEASSRHDYHLQEEKLRQLGFTPDQSPEAPICRWRIGELLLDLMPTDPAILGFANRWYGDALKQAIPVALPSGQIIRTLTPPHFLATKLEAFHGRGKGDYWGSHDMEDIVCLIDGRREISWRLPPAMTGYAITCEPNLPSSTVTRCSAKPSQAFSLATQSVKLAPHESVSGLALWLNDNNTDTGSTTLSKRISMAHSAPNF